MHPSTFCHVSPEAGTESFTVSVALPALVMVARSSPSGHFAATAPDVSPQIPAVPGLTMNRGSVPAFHFSAQGLDVAWQNTVAEAVPVPAIAMMAATARAARPIVLTYFITPP